MLPSVLSLLGFAAGSVIVVTSEPAFYHPLIGPALTSFQIIGPSAVSFEIVGPSPAYRDIIGP